ncbi:MAG: methyltransferase domain-containing protein [Trueperaceae bacterium]|nr:methyltransferase domain-containing protein [Trueperaceae bacterium]
MPIVDVNDLRNQVKDVYQRVAKEPDAEFHFRTGRELAADLGYPPELLDRIPEDSVRSFAGVGHYFDLLELREGDRVLDLGSGSGMDTFFAALRVGPRGEVVGLDMTDEQLDKAEALRREHGFDNVSFERGYIEELPFEGGRFDAVISNGVINLSAQKDEVFAEVARVLKPGGTLALADIVTERQLDEDIKCNESLWAACIGGAAQQDHYRALMTQAGLAVTVMRDNDAYGFLSKSAQGASRQFGVKSASLAARREAGVSA